ncbi:MAG: 30S ribosome-binding factor RbfA [Planctomycetes bacterium]|nr:30S ribosome-binding factor RbfA [Planctomycetota bacterium]
MATERRIARIESRIRQIVAELFVRDLKDPRMKGLITITRVKVARDLGHARVFFSFLGTARQKTTVEKFITSAQPFIQRAVASEVDLRVAPIVEFTYDDSIEKQAAVSKLIDHAMKGVKPARKKASDEEE